MSNTATERKAASIKAAKKKVAQELTELEVLELIPEELNARSVFTSFDMQHAVFETIIRLFPPHMMCSHQIPPLNSSIILKLSLIDCKLYI